MVKVRKGNSLTSIPDDRVADYLSRGYDLASDAGTVIKRAVPTDLVALQKLYTDQVATITKLEKQLSEGKTNNEEFAELQSKYDQLIKTCEDLEEKNYALEAEIERLKTSKKTRSKKGTETE